MRPAHTVTNLQLIGGMEAQQIADWFIQTFQKSNPKESPGNSVNKTQQLSLESTGRCWNTNEFKKNSFMQ